MRESVPTARYSPVCNVLRQWKTSLILTYRVYRLYDNTALYNNNTALYNNNTAESVDSISKDERGFPLTQYITNGRISRGGYTFTHFKHHHRVLRLISYRMGV